MPYLMHIAFDNTMRLTRAVHYFQYSGVRFKLIQNNPRKWSDVLLTVLESSSLPAEQRAYAAAGEFLSALAWHIHSPIALRPIGGMGVRQGFTLRQARCRIFHFPRVPWKGHHTGSLMSQIADIENADQRLALALFREARSANKVHLSILLYWQIMEIRNGDAIGWANKMQVRRPRGLHLPDDRIKRLPLQGRRLGEYLQDDCRHAIAHIRRSPGKRRLRFDDVEDEGRLMTSSYVLEELARYYIRTELGLTGTRYLVRRRGRGFPEYVDQKTLGAGWYVVVR